MNDWYHNKVFFFFFFPPFFILFHLLFLLNTLSSPHPPHLSFGFLVFIYIEGRDLARHFQCKFMESSARLRVNVDEAFFNLVREIRRFTDGGTDPGWPSSNKPGKLGR